MSKNKIVKIKNFVDLDSLVILPNHDLQLQFISTCDILEPINLKITQNQKSSFQLVCLFEHSICFNLELTIIGDNTSSKIHNLINLCENSTVELNQKITTECLNNNVKHFTKIVLEDNSIAIIKHTAKAKNLTKKLVLNQKIQALLLSPKSRVQMQPILQIESEDVSCKHGSTQGLLDDSALFYLQSRGLDSKTSKQFLINTFKSDILNMILI